jgi:hypothetical protein
VQIIGTLTTPVLRNTKAGQRNKENPNHSWRASHKTRKEEGRGLMLTEGAYVTEVMKLMEYVESKEDSLIQIVRTHQHSTLFQTVKNVKKSLESEIKQMKS